MKKEYDFVKIDFNANTISYRERQLNEYLEKGWKVDSVTSYTGKASYGIAAALSKAEGATQTQKFISVNFDDNNLASRQINPILDHMKDGWHVVLTTGFGSLDGSKYGVVAVMEPVPLQEDNI